MKIFSLQLLSIVFRDRFPEVDRRLRGSLCLHTDRPFRVRLWHHPSSAFTHGRVVGCLRTFSRLYRRRLDLCRLGWRCDRVRYGRGRSHYPLRWCRRRRCRRGRCFCRYSRLLGGRNWFTRRQLHVGYLCAKVCRCHDDAPCRTRTRRHCCRRGTDAVSVWPLDVDPVVACSRVPGCTSVPGVRHN